MNDHELAAGEYLVPTERVLVDTGEVRVVIVGEEIAPLIEQITTPAQQEEAPPQDQDIEAAGPVTPTTFEAWSEAHPIDLEVDDPNNLELAA